MPPTETVSVLPILHIKSTTDHGDTQVDLPAFQIRVKDPTRSLIELSIDVFPHDELLPVLITFVLQYKGDKSPFEVNSSPSRSMYGTHVHMQRQLLRILNCVCKYYRMTILTDS